MGHTQDNNSFFCVPITLDVYLSVLFPIVSVSLSLLTGSEIAIKMSQPGCSEEVKDWPIHFVILFLETGKIINLNPILSRVSTVMKDYRDYKF